MARVMGDLGQHDEAARAFAELVRDPRGASSQYVFFARVHEGRALEAAGRRDEAFEAYERTAAAYRAHLRDGGSPGAWTASAAEEMARALRTAPCDASLTVEQCEIARMAQEDLAYLAVQRSTDAYASVLERAAELGWYDDETQLAASRLGSAPEELLPSIRTTGLSRRRPGPETTL